MTTIELEILVKAHCIDAIADEEIRRYDTFDRSKTLNEAIELALECETTKVGEFRKRFAIHTIATDATNEVKENELNYIKTTKDIYMCPEIGKK